MEIFKLFGDKLINQEIKLEDLSKEELKIVLFFIDEAKSYINFLEKEFKDKGRSIPTQKIETQKKLELIIALIASKTSEDSENKVLETSQEIKFRVTINKFIDNLDKGKREVLL